MPAAANKNKKGRPCAAPSSHSTKLTLIVLIEIKSYAKR